MATDFKSSLLTNRFFQLTLLFQFTELLNTQLVELPVIWDFLGVYVWSVMAHENAWCTVRCNYLSLPQISASGGKASYIVVCILTWRHDAISRFPLSTFKVHT